MSCETAATCLCRGDLPADGVLEATIFSSYEAQITAVHGNVGAFVIGDVICVDQSIVGATILAPVKNGSDAAQVVLPPPDGGTCVPNYAYTLVLDDGGRPLACNAGNESQLTLATQTTIDALMASDCTAALAKNDARWSESSCAPGGCETSAPPASGMGALVMFALLLLFSFRRGRPRGSGARRAANR